MEVVEKEEHLPSFSMNYGKKRKMEAFYCSSIRSRMTTLAATRPKMAGI